MAFNPKYSITEKILNNLTLIVSAREVIEQAHLVPKWEASLRRKVIILRFRLTKAVSPEPVEGLMIIRKTWKIAGQA